MNIPGQGWNSSLRDVVIETPNASHKIQATAGVFVCYLSTSYQQGKILFLKTPHTLGPAYREINIQLSWRFPPCWLLFALLLHILGTLMGKKSH